MFKRSSFYHSFFLLPSIALTLLGVTSCACTDPVKPQANGQDKNNEKNHSTHEVAQLDTLNIVNTSITQAVAEVSPYKDSKISGRVTFKKVPGGIKIVADVDGLTPGKHGFHVHEVGDCSGEDGMKAGAHFNPTHRKHGGPDSPERHVGDLGNLEADANGHAHYERLDKIIAFEGENSILGLSIIIHADPDDLITQPTGNSGARIACGKIEPLEELSIRGRPSITPP